MIVIVGGGHAAGQAAAGLRQGGYGGKVLVVCDEPHIPYQRPPLSKQYLAGEQGLDRVYLRPDSFYEGRDIELVSGTRAAGIDRKAKVLALEDGSTVAYEKLLLATGARVRKLDIPGGTLPGVHYLRDIADADDIKADMLPGRRATIVGGGYIGLEVASVAVQAGLSVTVLEMEDRILKRVASPEMSDFYQALHTDAGVDIRTGASAERFAGTGRVEQVVCADGTRVPSDLVVVGIGIVPNVELAESAGLACENGIRVDERCTTSDPDIYAAGDCTNHPNPILERRLRLESVPNAMEQSRIAAANMAGGDSVYASMPWFWSDQYDLKLQMVGFSTDGDSHVVRGDPAERRFVMFHFSGDVLAAADAVNSPREFLACRQLVGRPADPGQLADPGTDLRQLAR
ncbi:MAG: FAD-dependent oxidoreductase [Gammaproteobacteria bacterium]|nr:FAD-dependent oxidoreductase [Gammaproteobacteria bacterium]